jgi:serine phosphatase RsbU (regulator of sigma subunit)
VRSHYEISRAFAQSLSLETTLEAVVGTFAELLRLDAVGIRMLDERGEALVTRALHVRDERMAKAIKTIMQRPQPLSPRLRSLLGGGRPLLLDPGIARELGGAYGLLVPFLERGSTTAIVPVSTPAEVLGTVSLVSLDPARPLGEADLELALSVGGQAALALENARLYQQQKRFADTMQRSLLPRVYPTIEGIELGDVYESSARLDVGGDVYDFLRLDDGRLAVALGDVTGHGIDAAADMAMAKFVFRSLAREHPEPADFLAAANQVVVGEVAPSKFITMLYLTVDPATGEVACGCAGHPWPRLVNTAGEVTALKASGLALGIEPGQSYDELRAQLAAGGAVVLYTDGVIEARRGGELYGDERLDALLAANAGLPAAELARAVVADCRAFTGGDLTDDCAVVVIRRT